MILDDEYLLLAKNIVASCKPIEILLMLKSTTTIKKHIADEIQLLDWCGMFIDCSIVSIDGRDGEYKRFVSYIADFFLDHLDIERFRKNLIIAANEKGYNVGMKDNNV